MIPSFRNKAIDILKRYEAIEPNEVCESELDYLEKQLLAVYTLGLNTAIKAIDKWTEVPTFPNRFNINNKTEK